MSGPDEFNVAATYFSTFVRGSIIGPLELNGRVRDGNGCGLQGIATTKALIFVVCSKGEGTHLRDLRIAQGAGAQSWGLCDRWEVRRLSRRDFGSAEPCAPSDLHELFAQQKDHLWMTFIDERSSRWTH